MRLEHKAGMDLIYELAANLYPSALESFREAISNGLDEGARKIEIKLATNGVIVEDYGEGINDIDKFVTFGDYSKKKLGGQIIGEKGLGKLALLRVGEQVFFRTNNGRYGMDITMTPTGFDVVNGGVDEFLKHQGTQILIPHPADLPTVDDLARYIKKVFALRMAKGIEIILNGSAQEARSDINPAESLICRLKGSIDVTGNIKADAKGKGSLYVHVKHVGICEVIIDPNRSFSGWVNCDALTPTTPRNDLKSNPIYLDFLEHLKREVQKYPKIGERIGKQETTLANEIAKLLHDCLKQMDLLPLGMLPYGKGKKISDKPLVETVTQNVTVPTGGTNTDAPTRDKVKRSLKTKYGFNMELTTEGNDQEPIYFMEPNILYLNLTNDITKFTTKAPANFGPKPLRILPWLARIAAQRDPAYAALNNHERNLKVDNAYRLLLSSKDYLPT